MDGKCRCMRHLLRPFESWILLGLLVATVGCTSPAPSPTSSCVVAIGASPQRGPSDAWVTIVEFADFECVYCGMAESTIAAVDAERPGLRWVFKQFPLTSSHAHALAAALAADCANQQGLFWEMHDTLFAHQTQLADASLTSYAEGLGLDMAVWNDCRVSSEANLRIRDDFDLGLKIGVEGTPTFFVNGAVLPGAPPKSDFIGLIDKAAQVAQNSGITQTDYYAAIENRGCQGL
jgi:protein-disulfide isomerase